MKKVIFLMLIMFGISNAYTQQDLINEIQKLALANDSLQKQVIKPLNDSVLNLNEKLKALEIENSELTKKNKALESSVDGLSKNKIKAENDNLKAQCNSLTIKVKDLENSISAKDEQIAQEKEKGKSDVLNVIIQTYDKPLDELIISTSLASIERDMSIIGDETKVPQKLLSLQKFFTAEQVLHEKYNEQKVANAKSQLKSIEQTVLVGKLIEKLKDYELRNDALKNTIDQILKIDGEYAANDEYAQNSKFYDVLVEIASYLRNYEFNFIDYPYLSEIVLEIIKLKQKNADADISTFKEKL